MLGQQTVSDVFVGQGPTLWSGASVFAQKSAGRAQLVLVHVHTALELPRAVLACVRQAAFWVTLLMSSPADLAGSRHVLGVVQGCAQGTQDQSPITVDPHQSTSCRDTANSRTRIVHDAHAGIVIVQSIQCAFDR